MMKTSVVLADSHVSVRQMLAALLRDDGRYEIVGEAATGYEAVQICRQNLPRLVIFDLWLPELNGVELLRLLRAEMRETRRLIYAGTTHRELILDALRAEPHGFVHKSDPLPVLLDAVRAVTAGCLFFTAHATQLRDHSHAVDPGAALLLTERERGVLQMVAEGLSTKEMAARLCIAPKTVEHHRAHLMEKLNLRCVAKLTRYAVRRGLVSEEG